MTATTYARLRNKQQSLLKWKDRVEGSFSLMETKLWSLQEVADYLQVPVATVYRWRHLRDGSGPPGFKVGRHVRYKASDVEAWLEEQSDRRTAVGGG